MGFTKEEIIAAKARKTLVLQMGDAQAKAIYMAGEICMWDEMQLLNECDHKYEYYIGDNYETVAVCKKCLNAYF